MQDSSNINIHSSAEFEEIYNLHWEKVYLQCVNKLNDSVVAKDLSNRLHFLIDYLPKQCKKVFTLSKIDGLSNKEISTELQISSSVKI